MNKFEKKFDNLEDAGEAIREKFGFEDKESAGSEEEKSQDLGAAAASVGKDAGKMIEEQKPKNTESGGVKFKYRDAIDKQSKELDDKLKIAEKDVDRVKRNKGTKEQVEERQKQVDYFKEEIKKAKEARARAIIKSKGITGFANNKKTIIMRSQVQAGIGEGRLKTYSDSNILTKKNTPEDAIEMDFKRKEVEARQKAKKLKDEKENINYFFNRSRAFK